jgi:transposase
MIAQDGLDQFPENLRNVVASLHNTIVELREDKRVLLKKLYGVTTEKHPAEVKFIAKEVLFNEVELILAEEKLEEQKNPVKSHERKKACGRKPLPESLPRERVVHEVPEEKMICPADGARLVEVGEEIVEKLEIVPASAKVIQHVYKKFVCPCCKGTIAKAPALPSAFPKAQIEPATVAHIILQKYTMSIPLYRQEQAFLQLGLEISRTRMAHWVIASATFLSDVICEIKKFILSHEVIHGDETRVQVLKGTDKVPTSQSYMWTLATTEESTQAAWYEFHGTRGSKAALELLADYKGAIHVDGYDGYNSAIELQKLTRIGCWAHARRGFDEAKIAGSGNGKTLSSQFLDEIQKLFLLDKEWADRPPDEKKQLRNIISKPIVEQIRQMVKNHMAEVPPKSKLGQAIGYLDRQWPTLVEFLKDGRYSLSNNHMERLIRPFTIGRKNWLFSDTVEGAHASAKFYSLLVTAKLNKVHLQSYLTDLLTQIPIEQAQATASKPFDVFKWLPWNYPNRI